jgi:uncharacterized phage-associated protein
MANFTYLPYRHSHEDSSTNENSESQNMDFNSYQKSCSQTIENEKSEKIVSVFDVASYILNKLSFKSSTTMKLHKLLYYCQAWSMVWSEKPIFQEKIEAWSNGPVIKELFHFHKGSYSIHYNDLTNGNEKLLSENQKGIVDDVLEFYGDKDPQWLIELTHSEDPWIEARRGLSLNERGNNEITLDSIQHYYSSL